MASRSEGRLWYEALAARSGGYVETWNSRIEGISGESVFAKRLFARLTLDMTVLDAGCGSGEFTLEVAQHAGSVYAIDFAENMIAAAEANARNYPGVDVHFIHASSHTLPFAENTFDLIYSRRGPTSIIEQSRLLKPGGWIVGVHSTGEQRLRRRLGRSGLEDVQLDHYSALEHFDTLDDFIAFWSRMPGHPDYSNSEDPEGLRCLLSKYRREDHFGVPHERYVWQARRPE